MKRFLALSVVAAACSGSHGSTADATANDSIGGGPCMLTLTGAVTGSSGCAPTTVWTSSNDRGMFSLLVSDVVGTQPSCAARVEVTWTGEPTTTTYDASVTGVSGVAMAGFGRTLWSTQAAGNSEPWMLTFTSVTNPTATSDGKSYTVHGSASATLGYDPLFRNGSIEYSTLGTEPVMMTLEF